MTDQKTRRTISLRIAVLMTVLPIVAVLATVAITEYLRQPPLVVTHADPATAAIAAIKDAAKTECHVKLDAEKPSASDSLSLEKQYEIAVHEAGHALLGRILTPEQGVKKLFLYAAQPAKSSYVGLTYYGDNVVKKTPDGNRRVAMRLYGGQAAEELILGNKPPADYSDKDIAGERLLNYCDGVGCPCPPKARIGKHCRLDMLLRVQRERFYPETMRCLSSNREALVALANLLFRKPAVTVPSGHEDAHGSADATWRLLETPELERFFSTHPLIACPSR